MALTTLAALAALASGCVSTGSRYMGVPGLSKGFSFDEGHGDMVSSRVGTNSGKIIGGLTWVDGKTGKALAFNGSGYVLLAACRT